MTLHAQFLPATRESRDMRALKRDRLPRRWPAHVLCHSATVCRAAACNLACASAASPSRALTVTQMQVVDSA
jgi:hypothetical protein